ncbi:MAG: NINE protein [Fibrobacter sp.]|nr:NINE protein [Fibrobacter sp.]
MYSPKSENSLPHPASVKEPLKNQKTALFLCCLLGLFGVHDFYAGNVVRGIAKLLLNIFSAILNLGYFGLYVWNVVDAYKICSGTYTDKLGRTLNPDTSKPLRIGLYALTIFFIVGATANVVRDMVVSRNPFYGLLNEIKPELIVTQENFDDKKKDIYKGQLIEIQGCVKETVGGVGVVIGTCGKSRSYPRLIVPELFGGLNGIELGDEMNIECNVSSLKNDSLICE